jgi:ADP-heptose:LPS heptosyltransferase
VTKGNPGALKRLERAWRALWIRLFTAAMRRAPSGGPDWGSRKHRVLFLRHDRAGDMILSTGVMRAIAGSHPAIELDVLASPANADILASAPYVGHVIVFDKRRAASYASTVRALRAGRYDAVIDCMVTAPSLTTLMLMAATGARYRVGIAGRGNDAAINVTVARPPGGERHMVEELSILAAAFGVDPVETNWSPTIDLTRSERDAAEREWVDPSHSNRGSAAAPTRFLVNISAGNPNRKWPVEGYIAVVRRIQSRRPGAVVRLIGAPAEGDRLAEVAAATGARAVETRGLRAALAMVATADQVVTPDTSIAHAASAFGRPCVVFYLAGDVPRWGPYGTKGFVVEHPEPHFETLKPERVLAAVDRMLEEGAC